MKPQSARLWPRGDHPREYGENPIFPTDLDNAHWIIPANTGKMQLMNLPGAGAWDHPREYGENTL